MSDYLNPAITELKQQIATVWPSIVKNDAGVKLYEYEHAAVVSFEELAADLPYAVLVVSEERPAGLDAEDSYGLVDVEVYFVNEAPGKPNTLRTRGQELRDALWPTDPLTLSQVWTKPAVTTSLKLDGNRILRAKKLPLLSVGVTFQLLTGEPSA